MADYKGHSTKRAAYAALRAQGCDFEEIARRTGSTFGNVRAELKRMDALGVVPAIGAEARIVSGVLSRSAIMGRNEARPASPERMRANNQARVSMRYRLQAPDGNWLRLDADGLVAEAHHGWIGFARQLDNLRNARPELATYRVVEVPPDVAAPTPFELGRGRNGVFGKRTHT